jgi:hypothetical protein
MPVTKEELAFIFELQRTAGRYDMTYVYNGGFSENLSDRILSLAEANMEEVEESAKVKKKVYFIMVESLQNITRHQDIKQENITGISSFFLIRRKANDYLITSGNSIENDKVEMLKVLLERVNSLDKDSLKDLQREILSEGDLSEKGGAGLGLIEIARKSGNKLFYDFEKINDLHSYFYFQTKVLGDSPLMTGGMEELHSMIDFHKEMSDKNIGIIYQGEFSQDNMLNLLSMAESNIGEGVENVLVRKKIFHITVELLQNIFKHADILENEQKERQGIFFIGSRNSQYFICAGNVVKDDKISALKKRIDEINSLDGNALEDKYIATIKEKEANGSISNGLGFIDIKAKSGNKLIYSFTSLPSGNSLFSVQVNVSNI